MQQCDDFMHRLAILQSHKYFFTTKPLLFYSGFIIIGSNIGNKYFGNSMKSYLKKNEHQAVTEFIKRIRLQLGDNLLVARLFGSKVRGDFTDDSDVDVLLILQELNSASIDMIVDELIDFQLEYDTNISSVIYSEYEYKVNTDLGSPFVKNIEQESILL